MIPRMTPDALRHGQDDGKAEQPRCEAHDRAKGDDEDRRQHHKHHRGDGF